MKIRDFFGWLVGLFKRKKQTKSPYPFDLKRVQFCSRTNQLPHLPETYTTNECVWGKRLVSWNPHHPNDWPTMLRSNNGSINAAMCVIRKNDDDGWIGHFVEWVLKGKAYQCGKNPLLQYRGKNLWPGAWGDVPRGEDTWLIIYGKHERSNPVKVEWT